MTGALIIVFLVLEPNGQRGLGRSVNKVEGVAFSHIEGAHSAPRFAAATGRSGSHVPMRAIEDRMQALSQKSARTREKRPCL